MQSFIVSGSYCDLAGVTQPFNGYMVPATDEQTAYDIVRADFQSRGFREIHLKVKVYYPPKWDMCFYTTPNPEV